VVTTAPDAVRCVAHPSRPAAEACEVCGRWRCAVDGLPGGGCAVCRGVPPSPERSARARRRSRIAALPLPERLIRAALVGQALAVVGGVLGYNYVKSSFYGLALPAIVGYAIGEAVAAVAGRSRPVLGVAAVYGGASALLAFLLGHERYDGPGTWLPPLLLGSVMALLPALAQRRPAAGAVSGGTSPR
jgi:hypothetical protein